MYTVYKWDIVYLLNEQREVYCLFFYYNLLTHVVRRSSRVTTWYYCCNFDLRMQCKSLYILSTRFILRNSCSDETIWKDKVSRITHEQGKETRGNKVAEKEQLTCCVAQITKRIDHWFKYPGCRNASLQIQDKGTLSPLHRYHPS